MEGDELTKIPLTTTCTVSKEYEPISAEKLTAARDKLDKAQLDSFRNIFGGIQVIKDWSGIAPANGYIILCGSKFYDRLSEATK